MSESAYFRLKMKWTIPFSNWREITQLFAKNLEIVSFLYTFASIKSSDFSIYGNDFQKQSP